MAPKALGASCDGDLFGECGDLLCTDGVCANRGTTAPATRETRPFVGDGERCENANCGAGLVCWPNDDASELSCRPKFDLGEHSLLAVQVTARVAKELGVELPVAIVFEARTIADLAAVVDLLGGRFRYGERW